MPGARTHDLITLASGVALAPLAVTVLSPIQSPAMVVTGTMLLVGAHLISGMLFSPDLDIDSSIDDRWGPLYWIWRPYMWVVPHRQFWSHGLVIPPLLRLLYFYGVVVVLITVLGWVTASSGWDIARQIDPLSRWILSVAWHSPVETGCFLVGFITGGAAHTLADWLVTGGKRYLRLLGIRVSRNYDNHDRWVPRRRRRAAWS